MDMNSDKSISLSRCCVVLFALLLAALDIGGYWFVGFFIRLRGMVWQSGVLMLVSIYTGSVFGWVTLLRRRRCDKRPQRAVLCAVSCDRDIGGVHGADREDSPERLSDRDRHEG